ncbi:MAG: DUF3494 domain-containing protein [Bacteroidetes bacterium]|nr:DUF3494 domain-containing protein [Bacteroidota bacterium]
MKKQLLNIVTAVALLSFPVTAFAQAPALGTAANFVLFTTVGANVNSGLSHVTGNVGTNSGSTTGYGNVNGQMHDNDLVTGQCATDLLAAYNQLNSTTAAFFPAPLLGNGQSLNAGVYSISGAATLSNTLTLDGQGNANAVFIIKISGPLSTNAGSKVVLMNGALACNVFWKIEGLVSMASGTSMKGNVIVNNAAINMSSGVTLEGRALSISGAVSINNGLAYTPVGCGSPVLTGPASPSLASAACYAIFSGNGPVTNTGNTYANGDVGTNVGLTTGYNPLNVTAIHPTPDGSTGACASDLLNAYNYLNTLPYDIELLYPAQFGQSLVLTPHTYVMNAAAMLVDTLFLDGAGNANAVFVIKINGTLSTSTFAKVILKNGIVAKNVFWCVNGAVNINDFTTFVGTIIANNGAMSLNKGVTLTGRALTTNGSVGTDSIKVTMPSGCTSSGISIKHLANEITAFYPNPFTNSTNVIVSEASEVNSSELKVYDILGTLVMNVTLIQKTTTLETNLPSGVYFYRILSKNGLNQTGKLVSQ